MPTLTPRPLFYLQKSPLLSFSKSHCVNGTGGLDALGQNPFVPAGNQTEMSLLVDLSALIAFVIKIF